MSCRVDPPLWLTFSGARSALGLGWVAWVGIACAFAWAAAAPFEQAGGVVPLFVLGWLAARRFPRPLDAFRRYHLDDLEISVLGPGRRVRRIPWSDVESVTQERSTLLLGGRRPVRLPLAAVHDAGAWAPVLVRVVPTVAQALWTKLERGRVRLRPPLDPSVSALAWWAWTPAGLACAIAGGTGGAALLAGVALGERVVAWLLAHRCEIQLHARGLTLVGHRHTFFAWSELVVAHHADGVGVGRSGHAPVLVPATLRDFWAVAPVIQLRAQLGPDVPAEVCFRARFDGGALAVVGEIEAQH